VSGWLDRWAQWIVLVGLIAGVVVAALVGGSVDDTPVPPTTTTEQAGTSTTEAPTTTVPPTTTTEATTTTVPPTTTTVVVPPVDPANWTRQTWVPSSSASEPTGNFRTFCRPTALGYIDPIVSPGRPSAHLHQIFGNTTTTEDSTYETLRSAAASTCDGGPLNLTPYWFPAMFDADGRVVVPQDMQIYYKGLGYAPGGLSGAQQSIRNITTLPAGLRMISEQRTWRCENNTNSGTRIPDTCNGSRLIGEVHFPSCWNGVDLDSPDHKSHMAFPTRDPNLGNLRCPASHPVHLVEITEIVSWAAASDISGWYLASDVPMGTTDGRSLHADWFGAWDPATLERWHQHCIREMRNCGSSQLGDGWSLSGSAQGMSGGRVDGWAPVP